MKNISSATSSCFTGKILPRNNSTSILVKGTVQQKKITADITCRRLAVLFFTLTLAVEECTIFPLNEILIRTRAIIHNIIK
jgi:hypothetical protein